MTIEVRFKARRGEFDLDIDLQLPVRGFTSLFGPSGCGKTTILRAIAGLDRHPGAVIRVGEMIWQQDRFFLPTHRRSLGYVFQESSLFDHLNIRRNLEYGIKRVARENRHIALDSAIELLEIGELLQRMPATLSGGERQRVAIARALALSPQLLLMDEPLAAVDIDRKQEIIPYIESLHRELKIPVIHVSHLPEEVARLADHLVLLDSGRVKAAGDVHDMFTRLDLALAQGTEASAIIEAVVAAHDHAYQLTLMDFGGGQIAIAGTDLPVGTPARLRLAARDVSLTLEHQTGTSILNIFPAVVDDISPAGAAQVTVRLMTSQVPLIASITRKSADDLKLAPGKQVFAQIKSIALLP
ncbi:MAG: molybdenum ABC transporter ATP-binding protein [Xanthomonadales bacterium]|nr:molybdenum ABC transporter ATP-binding protein [Xanthomonadales bacterium]